jgi:hypothetical protein
MHSTPRIEKSSEKTSKSNRNQAFENSRNSRGRNILSSPESLVDDVLSNSKISDFSSAHNSVSLTPVGGKTQEEDGRNRRYSLRGAGSTPPRPTRPRIPRHHKPSIKDYTQIHKNSQINQQDFAEAVLTCKPPIMKPPRRSLQSNTKLNISGNSKSNEAMDNADHVSDLSFDKLSGHSIGKDFGKVNQNTPEVAKNNEGEGQRKRGLAEVKNSPIVQKRHKLRSRTLSSGKLTLSQLKLSESVGKHVRSPSDTTNDSSNKSSNFFTRITRSNSIKSQKSEVSEIGKENVGNSSLMSKNETPTSKKKAPPKPPRRKLKDSTKHNSEQDLNHRRLSFRETVESGVARVKRGLSKASEYKQTMEDRRLSLNIAYAGTTPMPPKRSKNERVIL